MIELQHYLNILTRAIAANDTVGVLKYLENTEVLFHDSYEGAFLHAEIVYYSIKHANQTILKYLLNLPIFSDVPFFKFCGHTPISLAIEEGKQDLLPLLLSKTDKNFALHMAVKFNQEKTKTVLLSQCNFKPKFLHFLNL